MSVMTTVFVNGCFDILHVGHVRLFEFARSLGDRLVVGLDSDENVARSKLGRPINNLNHRMIMVSALRVVDDVKSFEDSKDLDRLISIVKPDILVVGSDWRGRPIVGSSHAGKVVYFERIPNLSTTAIIESARDR